MGASGRGLESTAWAVEALLADVRGYEAVYGAEHPPLREELVRASVLEYRSAVRERVLTDRVDDDVVAEVLSDKRVARSPHSRSWTARARVRRLAIDLERGGAMVVSSALVTAAHTIGRIASSTCLARAGIRCPWERLSTTITTPQRTNTTAAPPISGLIFDSNANNLAHPPTPSRSRL